MKIDFNTVFSANEVRTVTGISDGLLQSWTNRRYLAAGDYRVGSGHKRQYSLTNLFEVQFLLYATDNGLRMELARQLLDNFLVNVKAVLSGCAITDSADEKRFWIVDAKRTINPVVAELSSEGDLNAFGGGRFDLDDMPPLAFIVAIDQIVGRVIERARQIKAE